MVFYQDPRLVLYKRGSSKVKHNDVVRGSEGMTLVLHVSEGVTCKIHDLFFLWKNSSETNQYRVALTLYLDVFIETICQTFVNWVL